jgi:hypothetical protein
MLSKRGNHDKRKGTTRLAAIRVDEIDDSLEVILTILINSLVVRKLHSLRRDPDNPDAQQKLLPAVHICVRIKIRCGTFMKPPYRPEGTFAVITQHGELSEIKKTGGIYFCMPWVTLPSQLISMIDKDPISCYLTTYCF